MNADSLSGAREAVLRTVAFFDTMDYPPTVAEVGAWMEDGRDEQDDRTNRTTGLNPVRPVVPSSRMVHDVKTSLTAEGILEEKEGRLALRGRLVSLLALVHERTALFPRKIRTARKVARWLARNPNVRFVALANTTALAHARDGGDLDFFVITRAGTIWSTRLIGTGPYRIAGRVSADDSIPDAVCLSYFIADNALDLSSHLLSNGDDPYFRYWFLALLPLFDDGISEAFWNANKQIRSRHPRAERWISSPDLAVHRPLIRLPPLRPIESLARTFQQRWFPARIRERAASGDRSVVISDEALKFHVDDARADYRMRYDERLRSLGLL